MAKIVQFYVEGKSDKLFFEGSKFRDFLKSYGYALRVKNLKTKGNVLSNFEKFLKLTDKSTHASILVYDKDQKDFDERALEEILKKYPQTFHYVAIQELEAWFLADHDEMKKIDTSAKLARDTHAIPDPSNVLINIFYKAGKGYKTKMGLAEHFAPRINLSVARENNKSLNRFLSAFENHFK